ncbi:DNA topoisomerase 3 [Escherichia coli]|uniref:DNA topoisomerase 3 n=1 Tax=Morganella morganii TaxID=582 RepID=UPI00280887DC|nr:DNA topoisomerase 3 [Escherichia coli]ELA6789737.1 DNA topoisomerase 3 [Proteus mirabilis]
MRLFIAEKPAVGKDIANALGSAVRKDGYFQCGHDCVTWCVGHIIKSAEPEAYNPDYKSWTKSDLPLKMFPVKYEPKAETAAQVKIVVDLIEKADSICHVGDPDDEGQLLVDEILIYAGNTKPVQRVLINDNTPAAVKKALSSPQDNNHKKFRGMFNKALARSVGDAIFGMSMTRACTIDARENGYKGVLSVGRVQTPVLGLICQRYLDFTNHKESLYQTIQGQFLHETAGRFAANWKVSENAPQDEKKRLNNEDYAKRLTQSFTGKNAEIISAAVDEKETTPPLPFNLSELQQILNKKHKLSADKTLKITQDLREKYKCITYNRSDCSYLSDEQFAEAPQILEALKKSFPNQPNVDSQRKSKAFNSENVTAHTAIIPTTAVPDLTQLSEQEKIVYQIIVERYLIQFMPNKCYQEASVVLKIGLESFSTRAVNITNKGFSAFSAEESDDSGQNDEESGDFDILKKLRTGEAVRCEQATYKNNKTKPQPLFTEATLLNAMDNIVNFVTDPQIKALLKAKDAGKKKGQRGIGTQATRASFVPLLMKRGFIIIEKQKLIPTQAGLDFFQSLPKKVIQPDMTAFWSEKQNDIESGDLSVDNFIDALYADIEELLTQTAVKVTDKSSLQFLSFPCPCCNSGVTEKAKLVVCEKNCGWKFWKTIASKELSAKQIETLYEKGMTSFIKGFTGKNGKFEAQLKLEDKKTGKISFKFKPREVKK